MKVGQFRVSGEVHHWMYDSYSLGQLLREAGFNNVIRRTAAESYIEDWPGQQLDTEADGTVSKPDSLFMEAKRPDP